MSDHPARAEVLTLNEAADVLRVSRRTLERMVQRGEFPPAVKVGQQWRVSRAALDQFLSAPMRAKKTAGDGFAPASEPQPAADVRGNSP